MANNIVYSTDPDWKSTCPDCGEPVAECVCLKTKTESQRNQTAYIARDSKKRKGKTVTTISNLKGDLKNIQKKLQQLCGAGGTVKKGIIEIQGDHRDKIEAFLIKEGFKTKRAGG